jgi:hypothetical protein
MTTQQPTPAPQLLALTVTLLAAPRGDDDCDAPVERWQSRDAVRQMAAQRGWQVQRLKIDDGCYEIRGKDAEGREFKAKLDPETLEVVKMKRGDRDRDQERKREHDARGAAPQAAASAPTPSPLFTPGTAPRGQID